MVTPRKDPKDYLKRGAPTKYKPEYCEKILEFFSIPHTRTEYKIITRKDGSTEEIEVTVPNSLPTFERFSVSIGVTRESLHEWCKVHPEFSAAYKKAAEYQKDMLMDLGMIGLYNPTFTIFVAKNITDMKDRVETAITTDIKPTEADKFAQMVTGTKK